MPDWPHAPIHRFGNAGTYFITAGTHLKQHLFRSPAALDQLQELLFAKAEEHACRLQAWSLFSNHYHLVVQADAGEEVHRMLNRLHTESANALNQHEGATGRKVWYQFRDTQLTYEASWLARLRYTHENAVHHGLVGDAMNYRWCSASWFSETAKPAFVATVKSIKIDQVKVYDEYDLECSGTADPASLHARQRGA